MPGTASGPTSGRGLWHDAYAELLGRPVVAIAFANVALFVVAMTIFGPLGTLEDFRPPRRFLYWALCAVLTFPFCYALAAVTLYLTRFGSLIQIVPTVAVAVLFEGALCVAVVCAADWVFRPAEHAHIDLLNTYLTVTAVIAVCTFFVHYVTFQRVRNAGATAAADRSPDAAASPATNGDAAPAADAETASAGGDGTVGTAAPGDPAQPTTPQATAPQPTARQARFYDRLSRTVSRDVIYLKVDDHYVDVCTSGGSCLLLIRFADAVADLGDLGMQVHRSYWAAHCHMIATVRRDKRTMLRLTGGHEVPVSRSCLPAVRDALQAKRSQADRGVT